MAAILDERSSSDGDIFPYMFREAGLGPLIGRRSWGGVVGISGRGPLIDGGSDLGARVGPRQREGRVGHRGLRRRSRHRGRERPEVGASPGKDPQLERAVAEVMKKLQTPVALPKKPAPPVKVEKR